MVIFDWVYCWEMFGISGERECVPIIWKVLRLITKIRLEPFPEPNNFLRFWESARDLMLIPDHLSSREKTRSHADSISLYDGSREI